jgi:SAM-dependent methyltransferase
MRKPSAYSLSLSQYWTLFQLARRRAQSPQDYFWFEKFQGDLLVDFLRTRHFYERDFSVLDLGCGLGGYTVALKENGARQVVGLDLAHISLPNVLMVQGNALTLPFKSDQFDLVVCASLIEHLAGRRELINEIARVLVPGGKLYLSYPPFYSPRGGHQFSPYHLFGEKFALFMAKKRQVFRQEWLQDRYPSQPQAYAQAFGTWGLFPLTIRATRNLMNGLPFRMVEQSTRWLPIDFSHIPLLGEFLTWHVQFLYQKNP